MHLGRRPVWSPQRGHHVPGLPPHHDAGQRRRHSGRGVSLQLLASLYPWVVRHLFQVVMAEAV